MWIFLFFLGLSRCSSSFGSATQEEGKFSPNVHHGVFLHSSREGKATTPTQEDDSTGRNISIKITSFLYGHKDQTDSLRQRVRDRQIQTETERDRKRRDDRHRRAALRHARISSELVRKIKSKQSNQSFPNLHNNQSSVIPDSSAIPHSSLIPDSPLIPESSVIPDSSQVNSTPNQESKSFNPDGEMKVLKNDEEIGYDVFNNTPVVNSSGHITRDSNEKNSTTITTEIHVETKNPRQLLKMNSSGDTVLANSLNHSENLDISSVNDSRKSLVPKTNGSSLFSINSDLLRGALIKMKALNSSSKASKVEPDSETNVDSDHKEHGEERLSKIPKDENNNALSSAIDSGNFDSKNDSCTNSSAISCGPTTDQSRHDIKGMNTTSSARNTSIHRSNNTYSHNTRINFSNTSSVYKNIPFNSLRINKRNNLGAEYKDPILQGELSHNSPQENDSTNSVDKNSDGIADWQDEEEGKTKVNEEVNETNGFKVKTEEGGTLDKLGVITTSSEVNFKLYNPSSEELDETDTNKALKNSSSKHRSSSQTAKQDESTRTSSEDSLPNEDLRNNATFRRRDKKKGNRKGENLWEEVTSVTTSTISLSTKHIVMDTEKNYSPKTQQEDKHALQDTRMGRAPFYGSTGEEDIRLTSALENSHRRLFGDLSIKNGSSTSISPAGVIGIVLGTIVVLIIGCSVVVFLMNKRIDGFRPKILMSDRSCANSESGGYLDDQCRVTYMNSQTELSKTTPEDLISLDNDSFLNSLESMTIQNLWVDNIRHTKL